MKLKDTVELMLSDDFRDRLKAEYEQLNIRIQKLEAAIEHWTKDKNKLSRPVYLPLLRRQIHHMKAYRKALSERMWRIELNDNARKN